MTQRDFDSDVDWNEREGSDSAGPDSSAFDLLPPNLAEAEVDEVKAVEQGPFEPHPGQDEIEKQADPDEWDH